MSQMCWTLRPFSRLRYSTLPFDGFTQGIYDLSSVIPPNLTGRPSYSAISPCLYCSSESFICPLGAFSWFHGCFIRFSLVSPKSSPSDGFSGIPGLLLRGFFELGIKVRVLPSPASESHISHPSHRTGGLHRESTSNRIEEFLGHIWSKLGWLAHTSILPIKIHQNLVEKINQIRL